MTRPITVLRAACRPAIAGAALRVSLVVGVALNVINQGSSLLDGQAFDWGHGLLNFLVPYCVSSYSAALNATQECERDKR